MIFAYSSNAFVKFTLEESIEKIAKLGFGGLEIMCDKPHLYPPDYDEKKINALKSLLEKHNLKITNLNCFTLFAVGDTYLPSWIEPDKSRREIRIQHTLDCIKTARTLGCPYISTSPGGHIDNMGRKEAVALFHESLERVIPLAEELGIKILIEPEPELLIERTSEFKSFIKDVSSQAVALNFDMGHFFCVGEDPVAAINELIEWTCHIHIEDIGADRVHKHLVAGQGAMDFLSFFKALKSLNFEGDICLELYPYADSPEESGKNSMDYLMPLFNEAGLEISCTDA